MMRARFASLLAGLALFAFSGCAHFKTAYHFGDWGIKYWAGNYLELNDAQEKRLDQDIREYFFWHRENMLPAYSRLLHELAEHPGPTFSPAEFKGFALRVDALSDATLGHAIEPMARLFLSLSPQQVDHLEKRFAKAAERDRKKADPLRGPQNRIQANLDQWLSLLGRLDSLQAEYIRKAVPLLKMDGDAWLRRRIKHRAKLIDLLRQKATAADVEAELKLWLLSPSISAAQANPDLGQLSLDACRDYVNGVLALASAPQREHLRSTLLGYAQDCDELKSEPKAVPKPTAGP